MSGDGNMFSRNAPVEGNHSKLDTGLHCVEMSDLTNGSSGRKSPSKRRGVRILY
jgi:hypothetical protein